MSYTFTAKHHDSSTTAAGRLLAAFSTVLLITGLSTVNSASAQEDVGLLAGCWLPEGPDGDRLVLDPGGSYRMAGDVGRWSTETESLTLQPGRSQWQTWDLALVEGVMTLSSPRERRRVEGGTVESPPDPEDRRVFRRAPFAECGLNTELARPIETEPPGTFVPAPDGILLTNPQRNDPVEIRPAPAGGLLVCEILEDVCQPVGPEEERFEAGRPGLFPSATGELSEATVRVWTVRGGTEGGGLLRPDGQPCVVEGESTCRATEGFLLLVSDGGGTPVTGLVVLGSVQAPKFENALLTPPVGDVPPLIWIETGHHRERDGEYRWQAFAVRPGEEEGWQLISVAGPFRTGSYEVESGSLGTTGMAEQCRQVLRSAPELDEADGRVRLVADVLFGEEQARSLELVWAADIDRYQAWTSIPGPAPARERVCGQ